MVLVVERHAVLEALLVQRLEDHVAGAVGREARPLDRPLAVVPGVAAEPPLVDLAVRRPVERQAHVLELDHRLDGLAGEHLGRVLVHQVVATLDGVEHVPLPVVLLLVAQGGTHAALRGAGVGAGRVQLRQDRGVHAGLGQLERGPQARPAGADDERVVVADEGGHAGPGVGSVTRTIGAEDPEHDRAEVQEHRQDRPRAAARVVRHDRAHAHERVERDERQHQPVERAPRRGCSSARSPTPRSGSPGRTRGA